MRIGNCVNWKRICGVPPPGTACTSPQGRAYANIELRTAYGIHRKRYDDRPIAVELGSPNCESSTKEAALCPIPGDYLKPLDRPQRDSSLSAWRAIRRLMRSAQLPERPERVVEELNSQVAALREIQPGRLEITLVNGQVWRQTNSDRYRLRTGHDVRIYPSRFGHYFRLSAPALRGFVQVERVR